MARRAIQNNPIKLVFYFTDPKAIAAKIKAFGCEVTREPAPVPTLRNAMVGLAKDPDGYVIELLQAAPAKSGCTCEGGRRGLTPG